MITFETFHLVIEIIPYEAPPEPKTNIFFPSTLKFISCFNASQYPTPSVFSPYTLFFLKKRVLTALLFFCVQT